MRASQSPGHAPIQLDGSALCKSKGSRGLASLPLLLVAFLVGATASSCDMEPQVSTMREPGKRVQALTPLRGPSLDLQDLVLVVMVL